MVKEARTRTDTSKAGTSKEKRLEAGNCDICDATHCEAAMWFCTHCIEIAKERIVEYYKSEKQTKDMEKHLTVLSKNINDLGNVKEEMENIQKRINESSSTLTSIRENIESTEKNVKTFAELFHDKSGESSAKSFTRNLAQHTAAQIQKNVTEQEDRARNIIIFGVKESDGTIPKQRKDEDTRFFKSMCDALCIDHQNETLTTNIVRIGKKSAENKEKNRPMKISFSNTWHKRTLLSKLYILRDEEFKNTPLGKIKVAHDLSPEQREVTKSLLKEAWEKNEANPGATFLWKVRGRPTDPVLVKRPKVQGTG